MKLRKNDNDCYNSRHQYPGKNQRIENIVILMAMGQDQHHINQKSQKLHHLQYYLMNQLKYKNEPSEAYRKIEKLETEVRRLSMQFVAKANLQGLTKTLPLIAHNVLISHDTT